MRGRLSAWAWVPIGDGTAAAEESAVTHKHLTATVNEQCASHHRCRSRRCRSHGGGLERQFWARSLIPLHPLRIDRIGSDRIGSQWLRVFDLPCCRPSCIASLPFASVAELAVTARRIASRRCAVPVSAGLRVSPARRYRIAAAHRPLDQWTRTNDHTHSSHTASIGRCERRDD